MVALRPDRVTSDLEMSCTSLVRPCRYVRTASRYCCASSGLPRHEVDMDRLIALPKGVTTRSGWVRMTRKLSSEAWVALMSWKAWVGSSWLRSFLGYWEVLGTLVVASAS